ncbi:MAG: DUF4265 domain-containing protein [Acidobacteriota bacterium]|nr:DUF4265 domain-containing protein [Acidobacteriota bacterium]
MVKIKIPLSTDNLAGAEAEWIWAELQDNGLYVVKNIPFYAKGVSCEDLVQAEPDGPALVFRRVVRHNGHSTYRVYASVGRTAPDIAVLVGKLRGLHCDIEPATDNLIAIDVLPEADVYKVYNTLVEAEQKGMIDFQEGHFGHPLGTQTLPH